MASTAADGAGATGYRKGRKNVFSREKHSYSREELNAPDVTELFGPGTAQLPKPNMLMLDRITEIRAEGGEFGNGEVVAELDIHPDLWFFECHFPGDPVMPGCLGLDALWQLLGFFLSWSGHMGKGRAIGVKEVKFRGQVRPTASKVTYRLDVKRVLSTRLVLGIANGSMSVDGRQIYTASELRVGLFTSTDDF